VRRHVVETKWFDAIVLACIVASSVTLALADPLAPEGDETQATLSAIDTGFLVTFTVEAALKLFALGISKRCACRRGAQTSLQRVQPLGAASVSAAKHASAHAGGAASAPHQPGTGEPPSAEEAHPGSGGRDSRGRQGGRESRPSLSLKRRRASVMEAISGPAIDAMEGDDSGYFDSPWNWLDFIIVAAGYLEFVDGVDGGAASAVRLLRALRPLRTINRLRALKVIVTTLFTSFGDLAQVGVLLLFLWTVFSVAAVQLFAGALHRRCAAPGTQPMPNLDPLTGQQSLDASTSLGGFCSVLGQVGPPAANGSVDVFASPLGVCPPGLQCTVASRDPWFGYASFDSFPLALLNVYVVTSLANWTALMYMTFDTVGPASFFFFLLLTLLTSFFAMNLVVAVILDRFERATQESDDADVDGAVAAQAHEFDEALASLRASRAALRVALAAARLKSALSSRGLDASAADTIDMSEVRVGGGLDEATEVGEQARKLLGVPARMRSTLGAQRDRAVKMTDLATLAVARQRLVRFVPTPEVLAEARAVEVAAGTDGPPRASAASLSEGDSDCLGSGSDAPPPVPRAGSPSGRDAPSAPLLDRSASSSPRSVARALASSLAASPPPSPTAANAAPPLILSALGSSRRAGAAAAPTLPATDASAGRSLSAAPSGGGGLVVLTRGLSSGAERSGDDKAGSGAGSDRDVTDRTPGRGAQPARRGNKRAQGRRQSTVKYTEGLRAPADVMELPPYPGAQGGLLSRPGTRLVSAMILVRRADASLRLRAAYLARSPPCVLALNRAVLSWPFQAVILAAIVANTVTLAMDRYGVSAGEDFALEAVNVGLTALFALEMLLKLVGLGPREYARDGFNLFDAAVVLISLVELAVTGLPTPPDDPAADAVISSGGALSVLRAFRLLRVLKLAKAVKSVRTLLLAILESLPDVGWMTALLALFLFIFTVLARQLFAGKMRLIEGAGISFDSFGEAALAVLQVVTGDDYPTAMAAAAQATGSGWALLYFLVLQSFGAYIVISLFVAVLLAKLGQQTDDSLDEEDFLDEALVLRAASSPSRPGEAYVAAPELTDAESLAERMRQLHERRLAAVREKRKRAALGAGGVGGDSDDDGDGTETAISAGRGGATVDGRGTSGRGPGTASRGGGPGGMLLESMSGSVRDFTDVPSRQRMRHALSEADGGVSAVPSGPLTPIRPGGHGFGRPDRQPVEGASPAGRRPASNNAAGWGGGGDSSAMSEPPSPAAGWVAGTLEGLSSPEVAEADKADPGRWGDGADPPVGRALGCLPPDSGLRVALYALALSPAIEAVVLVLILASCVGLALDSPELQRPGSLADVLAVADVVFVVLFALEAALKMAAFGILTGPAPSNRLRQPQGYLRNGWNVVDFLAVVFAGLSLAFPDVAALRALRAVRPLRVVVRSPQIRIVLRALFAALPSIANVTALTVLLWTIYAILGVALFKGTLSECSDGAVDTKAACVGAFVDESGEPARREWAPTSANFDSYGGAMLTLFQASSLSDWASMARLMMGVRGVDVAPSGTGTPFNLLYLSSFVIVGSWLCLQLFTGVVVDRFSQLRREMDGSAFQTEKQRRWANTRKLLRAVNLQVRNDPPGQCVRLAAFRVVEDRRFEGAVMGAILLNTLAMMLVHHGQSPAWDAVLGAADWVFLAVFTLEAALKLLGLGPRTYFKDAWSRFDFVVVVGSYVTLFFDAGPYAPLLRVIRIGRVLRLIRKARTLHNLFQTLILALPSLYNIGGLLFILFFIFGVVGMSVCGGAPFTDPSDEGVSRFAHFRSFPMSVVTLYRVSTNDAWEGLLGSCRAAASSPVAEAVVTGFFVLFMVSVSMSMLQLLIAVVIETFTDRQEADAQEEPLERVQLWTGVWNSMYDPTAERWIPASLAASLQCEAPSPFGFASTSLSRAEVQQLLMRVRIPVVRRPRRAVVRAGRRYMARRHGEAEAGAGRGPAAEAESGAGVVHSSRGSDLTASEAPARSQDAAGAVSSSTSTLGRALRHARTEPPGSAAFDHKRGQPPPLRLQASEGPGGTVQVRSSLGPGAPPALPGTIVSRSASDTVSRGVDSGRAPSGVVAVSSRSRRALLPLGAIRSKSSRNLDSAKRALGTPKAADRARFGAHEPGESPWGTESEVGGVEGAAGKGAGLGESASAGGTAQAAAPPWAVPVGVRASRFACRPAEEAGNFAYGPVLPLLMYETEGGAGALAGLAGRAAQNVLKTDSGGKALEIEEEEEAEEEERGGAVPSSAGVDGRHAVAGPRVESGSAPTAGWAEAGAGAGRRSVTGVAGREAGGGGAPCPGGSGKPAPRAGWASMPAVDDTGAVTGLGPRAGSRSTSAWGATPAAGGARERQGAPPSAAPVSGVGPTTPVRQGQVAPAPIRRPGVGSDGRPAVATLSDSTPGAASPATVSRVRADVGSRHAGASTSGAVDDDDSVLDSASAARSDAGVSRAGVGWLSSWTSKRRLMTAPSTPKAGGARGSQTPSVRRDLWAVEFNGSIHALAKIVVGMRTARSKSRRKAGSGAGSGSGSGSRSFFLHEWFAAETISLWWQEVQRRDQLARSGAHAST